MDAHPNFVYSTVATAPSPATSGTSLVVASGDGALFAGQPFNAVIWPTGVQPLSTNAEIVRVTGRSTDTLTITRAQESTAARTVVVGDQIAVVASQKVFTDIETAVAACYTPGGTDVAIADGGTGASTAAAALANLGGGPGVAHIRKVGLYYSVHASTGDATLTPVKDTVIYVPFPIVTAFSIDRIALGVSAAGGATSVVRLGLYSSDANGQPSTLITDYGTIDGTSNTYQEKTVSPTQALTANTLYWVAVCWQVGTVSSGALRAFSPGNGSEYVGFAANSGDPRLCNYVQASVTGAFAGATPTTTNQTNTNPAVKVRIV